MALGTTWHKFLSTRKENNATSMFLSHQILYSQSYNIWALFQINCANVTEYCCIVLVIFAPFFFVQQCKSSQPNVLSQTVFNWDYYKCCIVLSTCLSFALRPRAERPCLPIVTESQHTNETSPSVHGLRAHTVHGLTIIPISLFHRAFLFTKFYVDQRMHLFLSYTKIT